MFIRPAHGLKIRDPLTMTHLPESGLEVVESGFWLRRVRDRDVEIAQKPYAQPETQEIEE